MKTATKTATRRIDKQVGKRKPGLSDESRMRVERATVRLVKKGGQGVLIPGGFILTATHCIKWSGTGRMALRDPYFAEIQTAGGVKFQTSVCACDPVTDIAALEEVDNQQFPDDASAFERWREQVRPVTLSDRTFKEEQSCPVFIYTHKGKWIAGKVTRCGPVGGTLELFAQGIKGGTSGSPVVTADGMLLGVVSHTREKVGDGEPCGSMPVANMSLPHWVLKRSRYRGWSRAKASKR